MRAASKSGTSTTPQHMGCVAVPPTASPQHRASDLPAVIQKPAFALWRMRAQPFLIGLRAPARTIGHDEIAMGGKSARHAYAFRSYPSLGRNWTDRPGSTKNTRARTQRTSERFGGGSDRRSDTRCRERRTKDEPQATAAGRARGISGRSGGSSQSKSQVMPIYSRCSPGGRRGTYADHRGKLSARGARALQRIVALCRISVN
jgi:hypothetical protein